MPVMFSSNSFLFGWSSVVAILGTRCRKHCPYMGRLGEEIFQSTAPMTSEHMGFTGFHKYDSIFPDLFSYHCIIHQQAVCTIDQLSTYVRCCVENCKLDLC
jgi:hypothetical protein